MLDLFSHDRLSVPLVISSVKTLCQIVLELALVSRVHAPGVTPSVQTQASVRLVCE